METSGPVQACNGTAFYLFNEPTNAQGKIYYIVCILYYIILYYIILYYIILYYIINRLHVWVAFVGLLRECKFSIKERI